MQLRKPFSLLLIALLLLSTCAALIPTGSVEASDKPTMEEGKTDDENDEEMMGDAVTFRVRIENISGDSDLPTPFAPGVWALHSESGPLFTSGEADRGQGLESLAEDGNPAMLAEALTSMDILAGVFNTPVGADGPGPLLPGGAYEFEVTATPETPYLSFATMFVQSNDLFLAPDQMGIALFDMDGMAMEMHEITADLLLWDAGTEANEEPGAGPNQAPRQADPNTGPADGMATVHPVDDGFTYPDVAALVRVSIEPVMMAHHQMMDDGMGEMMDDAGMPPYIVQQGDTLSAISLHTYGRSKYWPAICAANSLSNCNRIYVGDVLTLPTEAQADALLAEMEEMMDDDMDMDKMDDKEE